MVQDRFGTKVFAAVDDADHGAALPIDGGSARWLVDTHGPKDGVRLVLDYAIEWDGAAFHVDGVDVQSLTGVPRYTWEPDGVVYVRKARRRSGTPLHPGQPGALAP